MAWMYHEVFVDEDILTEITSYGHAWVPVADTASEVQIGPLADWQLDNLARGMAIFLDHSLNSHDNMAIKVYPAGGLFNADHDAYNDFLGSAHPAMTDAADVLLVAPNNSYLEGDYHAVNVQLGNYMRAQILFDGAEWEELQLIGSLVVNAPLVAEDRSFIIQLQDN